MEIENDYKSQSFFAKYNGVLKLGRFLVDCYVLDTGERVISLRAVVRAISGSDSSALENYIGIKPLEQYLNVNDIMKGLIEFKIPGIPNISKGITAERFLDICQAYVNALDSGFLTTERQNEIAIKCSILLSACAKVGIIALIDEATGYQYIRQPDELELKLKLFIAEEMREWEKTFPDGLWEQFGRLDHWKEPLHKRPKWWGKLVMELIYDALDKDVSDHLRENKPTPIHGQNYHQWLTENYGLKQLLSHINQIIGIAMTCSDMKELREKVAYHYKGKAYHPRLFENIDKS